MSVRNKPFSLRPGQAATASDRVLLGLHEPDPFDASVRTGPDTAEAASALPSASLPSLPSPSPSPSSSPPSLAPLSASSSRPLAVLEPEPPIPAPDRSSAPGNRGNIQATVRYPARYRDLLEQASDRLGWSGSQTLLVLLEGPLAELEGRVRRDGWEEAIRWLNSQRMEQRRRQRSAG